MYIKRYNKLVKKIEMDNEKLIIPVEHFDFNNINLTEVARLANERLINYIINKQNTDIPVEILESFFRIELLKELKEYINKNG